MEAGKSARYVAPLIKHFGDTPLLEIDQAAIDEAASKLKSNVTAGTRNAAIYTPVSAILHHAGIKIAIRRPKGAKGRIITDWLTSADAFGIIGAAEVFDVEFATAAPALITLVFVRFDQALNLSAVLSRNF